jgi:hypothetical protein
LTVLLTGCGEEQGEPDSHPAPPSSGTLTGLWRFEYTVPPKTDSDFMRLRLAETGGAVTGNLCSEPQICNDGGCTPTNTCTGAPVTGTFSNPEFMLGWTFDDEGRIYDITMTGTLSIDADSAVSRISGTSCNCTFNARGMRIE